MMERNSEYARDVLEHDPESIPTYHVVHEDAEHEPVVHGDSSLLSLKQKSPNLTNPMTDTSSSSENSSSDMDSSENSSSSSESSDEVAENKL